MGNKTSNADEVGLATNTTTTTPFDDDMVENEQMKHELIDNKTCDGSFESFDMMPQLIIAGVNETKKPRRIVKATPPRKVVSTGSTSNSKDNTSTEDESESGVLVRSGKKINESSDDDDDEEVVYDDDDGFEKVNYNNVTASFIANESVAREMEQEKAAMIKNELIQSANERHRTKREAEIKSRRQQKELENQTSSNIDKHQQLQPTVPSSDGLDGARTSSTSSAKGFIKANPMSKFLSAFSVEEHPQHKRTLPKGSGQYLVASVPAVDSVDGKGTVKNKLTMKNISSPNEDKVHEPYGKKLKQSPPTDRIVPKSVTDNNNNDDTSPEKKDDDEWWTNFVVRTTTVAASIFLVAIVVIRWKRSKIV